MCGHSLEVNVTTSLDFFFSVAQVQLLQQLLQANVVGSEAPEKAAEVTLGGSECFYRLQLPLYKL